MEYLLPSLLKTLLPVVIITFASGCSEKETNNKKVNNLSNSTNEFNVTGVNNYEFLFNDTEKGGMINFSSSNLKQCNLSFIKSNFLKGYKESISKLGEGAIDLTCLSDKDYFAMNSSGSTFVQISVTKLSNSAVVNLDFSLYSIRSKSALTKHNVTLVVNEQQLKTLLAY